MSVDQRDVVVLDDEDPSVHDSMARLDGCSVVINNSESEPDQLQQDIPCSNFRPFSIASVPRVTDPTTAPQASCAVSQALPEVHHLRGSSGWGVEKSSQLSPQNSVKNTPKAYAMTNNMNPAYFAASSWSFPTTTASYTQPITPSKPESRLSKHFGLRCHESACATVIDCKSSPAIQRSPLLPQPTIIELIDDDDSLNEKNLAIWMAQDVEDEMRQSCLVNEKSNEKSKATTLRRPSTLIPRNLPITSPFISLATYAHKGILLAEKVCVELQDGDFLRIVHIIQDTCTLAVALRGWKFRRTREMNGVIDRKLNEVCWILHIDDDDPRDAKLQGMETMPVCEVVKRRHIRLTNQSFPALSWREDGSKEISETVQNERVLVCRFKYICVYADVKARASYTWCEKGFYRLREDECDQRPDNKIPDEGLRNAWRGSTVPGGAQKGWLKGEKEFLRQEKLSHEGIVGRSSLEASSGQYFSIGDPMKRGSVGYLLTDYDLRRSSDQARRNTGLGKDELALVHAVDKSVGEDDAMQIRPSEQRHEWRQSKCNFAGFNGISSESSGFDTDENYRISVLRRAFRKGSFQRGISKNKPPRVVEIDAQLRTTSISGTFEERYEAKLTSRYYSTSSLPQKRPAGMSFDSRAGPTKRIDRGIRVDFDEGDLGDGRGGQGGRTLTGDHKYTQPEPTSDSDETLGRCQSSDSIEDMYPPSEFGRYKKPMSGLSAPVSQKKNSLSRRSIQLSELGNFVEYNQRSMPLSWTAQPSVVDQKQAYGFTEDDDIIVDLTSPQAPPHGSFSNACSGYWQHSPPKPSRTHSDLSANPDKTLSSRKRSAWPIIASSPFNSMSRVASLRMPQNFHSEATQHLPANSGPSHTYKMLSHRSPKATPDPLSRCIKKSRQRQFTSINASAPKASRQRYTFGDCFSGAGGMSRGAVSAGLRIKWAFDFSLAACQTYSMNFFGTPVYNVWANQFSEAKGDRKCDICHLSPPCQFFSDAHTIQGKDDDMNTASLFAVFNLLEKAKPRIVTLEQTSGLIRRHPIFFNALINMFTSRGFSVRWKVMNCADFGLPQRRTRLFIIASCPGEALPPFPRPTHSSNPEETGLKPYSTINEAIANIPFGWANHDIHKARERDNSPQSGDKIATCITTSGGGIIHPSGKRDYTHREFACLQSFPLGHKFGASGVKKQIGNAVPPTMAKILLEAIINALLKADGLM